MLIRDLSNIIHNQYQPRRRWFSRGHPAIRALRRTLNNWHNPEDAPLSPAQQARIIRHFVTHRAEEGRQSPQSAYQVALVILCTLYQNVLSAEKAASVYAIMAEQTQHGQNTDAMQHITQTLHTINQSPQARNLGSIIEPLLSLAIRENRLDLPLQTIHDALENNLMNVTEAAAFLAYGGHWVDETQGHATFVLKAYRALHNSVSLNADTALAIATFMRQPDGDTTMRFMEASAPPEAMIELILTLSDLDLINKGLSLDEINHLYDRIFIDPQPYHAHFEENIETVSLLCQYFSGLNQADEAEKNHFLSAVFPENPSDEPHNPKAIARLLTDPIYQDGYNGLNNEEQTEARQAANRIISLRATTPEAMRALSPINIRRVDLNEGWYFSDDTGETASEADAAEEDHAGAAPEADHPVTEPIEPDSYVLDDEAEWEALPDDIMAGAAPHFSGETAVLIGTTTPAIPEQRIAQLNKLSGEDIPDAFLCPITREVMAQPVLTADGHSYDEESITQWLGQADSSPKTNMALPHKRLIPNHALKIAIEATIQDAIKTAAVPAAAHGEGGGASQASLPNTAPCKKTPLSSGHLLTPKKASMAPAQHSEDDGTLCPLSGVLMTNPVTTPSGDSYHKEALIKHLIMHQTDPTTEQQPLTIEDCRPNHALKTLVAEQNEASSTHSPLPGRHCASFLMVLFLSASMMLPYIH